MVMAHGALCGLVTTGLATRRSWVCVPTILLVLIVKRRYGPDWFTARRSQARSSHPSPGWPGFSDAALVTSLVAVSKEPGWSETMIGCLGQQASRTFFTCALSRVPSPTHRASLAPGKRANSSVSREPGWWEFLGILTLYYYNDRHILR